MEKNRQFRRQFLRSKGLPLFVIGLTLAVLAATIAAGCLRLRHSVREQILGRDGETLYQVARWQQQNPDVGEGGAGASIADPSEQFNLILKISQIKGVVGIRLFEANGAFRTAFPATITEGAISADDVARLRARETTSHFYPAIDLASVDMLSGLDAKAARVPLLEVNVPLYPGESGELAGIAQFLISGESIAREYATLDAHLWLHGCVSFLVAGGILAVALALAFRTITKQTERLLQTNQELLQAAKTSAVGAVTSHLIHGLKNPLSGLQGFVKSHLRGEGAAANADWQDAMETTQRMQALIGGVVRILEEQQTAADYEISWPELADLLSARLLPVARSMGLHFYCQVKAEGMLANREANLTLLILENLIQNAFQATPEGKSVRLEIAQEDGIVQCDVRDEGPGLSDEVRERLFAPCRSTRPGGSGIGLAISKQLATQIGAVLELRSTSSSGCVFRLSLPQKQDAAKPLVETVVTRI
jgi:signal transduction histidine kinase